MWKYTHTDEMYHGLTGRNNSTELFHSDTYLGQDFSDGIRHFKYIKREMVNGRWRYYYKDDAYDKAKANAQAASDRWNSAKNRMAQLEKANEKGNEQIEKNNDVIRKYNRSGVIGKIVRGKKVKAASKSNDKISKQQREYQSEYSKEYEKSRKAMYEVENAQYEQHKAYNKDKARKVAAKAGVAVANAASATGYSIKKQAKKGKKAVQKQLNKLKKKKKK